MGLFVVFTWDFVACGVFGMFFLWEYTPGRDARFVYSMDDVCHFICFLHLYLASCMSLELWWVCLVWFPIMVRGTGVFGLEIGDCMDRWVGVQVDTGGYFICIQMFDHIGGGFFSSGGYVVAVLR